MVNQKLSVNIVGASGYVGADLLRIVLGHPNFELKDIFAFSKANIEIGELFPNLQFLLPVKKLLSSEVARIDN